MPYLYPDTAMVFLIILCLGMIVGSAYHQRNER